MFFILSYLANPIFVYLIHTEISFQFGDYKYLLYFFAVFNMTSSLVDVSVPIIMSYLKQGVSFMSPRTMNMQKRSFWALFVQTVIPICVSFMPCTIALYGSVFRLEFSSSINYMSSIAISTFPFLDPLAITMCLPALRRRLFQNMGIKISQNPST
ncbi:hypothetical protein B9Z55_018182 [Caenorhabditis nigoni]|uniref:Uncharacterized protein n=1 Tax=Caenorhabditis nigoni TaxID=1611254 RepID=A0A2G5TDK3_9PELO|nr:hypothetical protein B9Z55_018182 [Caenorhabditis nigoni]